MMGNWRVVVSGSSKDLAIDYGFSVEQQPGTGMASIENISTPFGLLDGALFQRTKTSQRTFTLVGTLAGSSVEDLHKKRRTLIDIFKPDRFYPQEPIVFQYTGGGSTLQASAYYETGLELGNTSVWTEAKIGLRFAMFNPYPELTLSSSAALSIGESQEVNFVAQRSPTGAWSAMDAGFNGQVKSLITSPTGEIYAGGTFDSAGSIAACRVAKWNGNEWQALDAGISGSSIGGSPIVNDMVLGSNGDLYVGGNFDTAGSITACRVAKFNGTTWSAFDGGMNNSVCALALSSTGKLYAGGEFTQAGSISMLRLAQFDNPEWGRVGGASITGTTSPCIVNTLAINQNDVLYIGGNYTDLGVTALGGGTQRRVNYYDGANWYTMSNVNGQVYDLAIGDNARVFAVGAFTAASDTAASLQAYWNGAQWFPLDPNVDWTQSGCSGGSPQVVYKSHQGNIYLGGTFAKPSNVPPLFQLAKWDGVNKLLSENMIASSSAVLGNANGITAITSSSAGDLYIGMNFTSSACVAGVATVTNSGTKGVKPVINASGPGGLVSLENSTTGQIIYFGITLQTGEVVTLDIPKTKFTSSIRGNIISKIAPNSNLTTFELVSGSNGIKLTTTGNTASAVMTWTPRYWAFDGSD